MVSGGLERSSERTDSDIPMGVVAVLAAVVAVAIWLYFRFSVLAGIPDATRLATLSLILTLVISFLFAAVSAWAVAMISVMVGFAVWWGVLFLLTLLLPEEQRDQRD